MKFHAPIGAYGVVRIQGNYQPMLVHHDSNAGKGTSLDATLTLKGKRKGRSPLSEAKERTTVMLMQGFISLMGEAR